MSLGRHSRGADSEVKNTSSTVFTLAVSVTENIVFSFCTMDILERFALRSKENYKQRKRTNVLMSSPSYLKSK